MLILPRNYTFVPIALETLGPMNTAGMELVRCIGRRIAAIISDSREIHLNCYTILFYKF
jgi:hypothetical protein